MIIIIKQEYKNFNNLIIILNLVFSSILLMIQHTCRRNTITIYKAFLHYIIYVCQLDFYTTV